MFLTLLPTGFLTQDYKGGGMGGSFIFHLAASDIMSASALHDSDKNITDVMNNCRNIRKMSPF